MLVSEYEIRKEETLRLKRHLRKFVSNCRKYDITELIDPAENLIDEVEKQDEILPEELSRQYNKLVRLKTAFKLAILRNEYKNKGEYESANKMQERVEAWSKDDIKESHLERKVKKWNTGWLYVLKMIFLIVVLPMCGGFLLYMYVEYLLIFVFIIPGIIAFLGSALKNGGKV